MLEHHPIETKDFDGYLVECPQNILANDFEGSLSKLDHLLHVQKNAANNLTITYPNSNVKVPMMLIELIADLLIK